MVSFDLIEKPIKQKQIRMTQFLINCYLQQTVILEQLIKIWSLTIYWIYYNNSNFKQQQKIEYTKFPNSMQQDTWKTDFKSQLFKAKQPFLNKVDQSKNKFKNIMKNLQNQNNSITLYESLIQIIIKKLLQSKNFQQSNHEQQVQPKPQLQIDSDTNIKFQSSKRKVSEQSQQNHHDQDNLQSMFSQWKGADKQRAFKAYQNVVENFNTIFQQKINPSSIKLKDYSFKTQQKQMFTKIFRQISKKQNSAEFQQIISFFQKCSLFYKIYNIDRQQLLDLISSSAHTYSDKLTQDQFIHMFLYNMKQIQDLNYLDGKNNRTCLMNEQSWKDLKQVFNSLDTYGDNIISIQGFFFKLNNNPSYQQLMSTIVISYPSIKKQYSLSKIVFDLQNKVKFSQKMSWQEIKARIQNFQHVEYPTIDQINQQKLKKASISKSFNTFLLRKQILDLLKQQFKKCPKFCHRFVKCKFFCEELLRTQQIKQYFTQYVRKQKQNKKYITVTLQRNIRLVFIHGPQYFDLDQMLQFFSVKGFYQIQNKTNKDLFENSSTTSSDDFQQHKISIMKAKKIFDSQKNKKKQTKESSIQRKIISKSLTKIEPFNLSQKSKISIRQTKLHQMLVQMAKKEQQQLKTHVKANPIPASINTQRYTQQIHSKQQMKQITKERLSKKYQQYDKRIKYLQANTKLFEKKSHNKQEYEFVLHKKPFQSNITPWFVKENLLQSIQNQKQTKRNNRIRQTKQRYQEKYWKNLPNFQKYNQKLDQSLEQQIKQIKNTLQSQNNQFRSLPVPDFIRLQNQFATQLQYKKKHFQPTIIKQFKLSSPKQTHKHQNIISKQIQTNLKAKSLDKQNVRSFSANKDKLIIGTTKKFQSLVQYNQKKVLQENLQKQIKYKQQQERRIKQQIFGKYMQKALKKTKKAKKSRTQKQLKNTKQSNNQNYLKDIYTRVLNRPFLFEQDYKTVANSSERQNISSQRKHVKTQRPKKVHIPNQDSTLKNGKIDQVQSAIQWDQQQIEDYSKMNQENQKYNENRQSSQKQVNQSF